MKNYEERNDHRQADLGERGTDSDEELGAVSARPSIGHADGEGSVVTERRVELIL